MKKLAWFLALSMLFLPTVGCRKKRPDPRKLPGFKDTTDPSKVREDSPPPQKQPSSGFR